MTARAALIALPLVLAATTLPAAPPPAQVTIYRCIDAAGRLSLRDSPCRKGEKQEVRAMLRPTDPPPHRATPAAPRRAPTPVADATPALPRVVYLTPPRPLFECTTPDGARCTSESPEGNPRWVPLWTLGGPVLVMPPGHGGRGGYGAHVDYRDGDRRVRIDAGRRWRTPGTVVGPSSAYAPAGTWIRDTCHALPPEEVCARLVDERERLDRRYNSALQGERDTIVRTQRGIDARLASECRR